MAELAEAHLSTLDLASLLAGYLSLGCSLWSAFPQIYLLASFPPTGGPLLWMLILWLLGDALQVSGMYIHGALDTQKLSGIWFGISDIIIMLEMAIGRGWLPGTPCWARRKQSKTHQPLSIGEDQRRSEEEEDVGYGPTPLPASAAAGEKTRSPALRRLRAFIRRWMPNFDGARANAVVLVLLLVVGVACWVGLDVVRREEKKALKPGEPPHGKASWIGWATAMAGMVCYISPRVAQIVKIARDKSMENTSVWMFGWLLAQNYTMLISILTVSHTLDAMYGQAPFLLNTLAALACDHIIVYLWRKYRHPPRSNTPQHPLPHPTQSGLARAASLLSRHSPSPPPSPSHRHSPSPALLRTYGHSTASDSGSDSETEEKHDAALARARARLAASYRSSLAQERARTSHGRAANLPVLSRRALAHELDARAAREEGALSDLEGRASSADEEEQGRQAQWVKQSAETRAMLRKERELRRRSDARAEERLKGELGEWKEDRRRRGLPVRSDEEDSGGFTSGEDSSQDERPLTSHVGGTRVRHPRRGVGTA
ncbi:Putative vacuolar membrane transporter for cationic amino acids [Rhodotorula kratochvilovae]